VFKRGFSIVGLLLVAACLPVGTGGGMQRLSLLGGAFTAAAPNGYCIDPQSVQAQADSAVVLMGRCNAALATAPALFTLSVGETGSEEAIAGGADALAAFFTSDVGRATLSRDGQADQVTVSHAEAVGSAFVIQVDDAAAGVYWRAIVGLNGRAVALSVAGPEGAPLSDAAGRKLLDAALVALETANPAVAPAIPAVAQDEAVIPSENG
jgi:hypothetical protein